MAIPAKVKKVTKIVVNVLLWMFLAFALFITIMALAAQGDSTGQPSMFGQYLLTVSSDSMSPTFRQGDIILGTKLTEEQKQQLKADDVITFRTTINGEQALNTHRIISVAYDDSGKVMYFITKGDNPETNTMVDEYRPMTADIIARWDGAKLNGVGNLLIFLQTSTGFLVCIVIPMAIFFIYEVYKFIRTLISVKNEGKKVITAEDEELIKKRAVEEYLRQQAANNGDASQQNTDSPGDGSN